MPATPSPPCLLSLPPELLLQILASLPVRALLSFSLASRSSHALSLSSLHTLSFAIHTSRAASTTSRLTAWDLPAITSTHSAFSRTHKSPTKANQPSESPLDPHAISTIIPRPHLHRLPTLLKFHLVLHSSILTRYSSSLRTLSLSLWTLPAALTPALRRLTNIRVLTIRIDDTATLHCPRRSSTRADERNAWTQLAGAWPRLTALQLENCDLSVRQLVGVVAAAPQLRELWVRRCHKLNAAGSLFGALATSVPRLEVLGLDCCGGEIDEKVLTPVGGMRGLRYLALLGMHERVPGSVERAAAKVWRIAEVVLPKSVGEEDSDVIEVDPAYMAGGEGDVVESFGSTGRVFWIHERWTH
ncbi:hypothetical protein EJ05DRAFT_64612 [Pseudovirgaria hyperparasitica]|uniref:F-box domain-containing protein n=1 Tax=Pseudovirgaria hyperparasitica TaxID=470096 RepID=A0A6A6W1K4_9PEZI|nr:uncharacterized protein EJ05DRAFT_64612 [Pseudovirgaria hyperparasitica]KAF2756415.1 hypothetical protein EJ05DRAFT_64612 [Pseudovirgaria hyperparasitica]